MSTLHGYDSITQNMTTIPSSINITNVYGITAPKIIDYPIQGKMLTTSITLSPYEAEQMDDIELKNRLITMMVREILDNKCIEFTKQQDYAKDEVVIRARIFVTPDSDVKLIRKFQNDNTN